MAEARSKPAKPDMDVAGLLEAGYELFPLSGISKVRPKGLRWRVESFSPEALERAVAGGNNLAVRLGLDQMVLDHDPRNDPDGDALDRLLRECDIDAEDCLTVETGGGGTHVYLRVDAEARLGGSIDGYPRVDVKKVGGYVLAPGSIHPDTGRRYVATKAEWEGGFSSSVDASTRLIELAAKPDVTMSSDADDFVAVLTGEQLGDALSRLDVTDFAENEAWIELLMACKAAAGEEGRDAFLDWSEGDARYDGDPSLPVRWASVSPSGGVTARTLLRALIRADAGDCEAARLIAGGVADGRRGRRSERKNHGIRWFARL